MSEVYTDALKASRAAYIEDWQNVLWKPSHYQHTLDKMDSMIAARLLPKHRIQASHSESKINSAFKTMKMTCALTTDQQKRIWKILTELKSEL